MQMSWMRQVTGLLVCGGLAAMMVVGCSDDEVTPEPSPAKQQCGGTVESMAGKDCTESDLFCSVPVPCYGENDFQPAGCTCTGLVDEEGRPFMKNGVQVKQFVCKNPDQSDIAEGEQPRCTNETTPNEACPSSPSSAHMTQCGSVHQTCRYAREACEGEAIGYYDTCMCQVLPVEGSETEVKAQWLCTVKECPEVSSSSSGGSSSGGSSSGGSSSGGSSSGGSSSGGSSSGGNN